MDNLIDGTDGKLGHGFTSANELKEIDIGSRDRPRPTYISAKLDPKYNQDVGTESDQLVNIYSFVVRCDRMWPSTQ